MKSPRPFFTCSGKLSAQVIVGCNHRSFGFYADRRWLAKSAPEADLVCPNLKGPLDLGGVGFFRHH